MSRTIKNLFLFAAAAGAVSAGIWLIQSGAAPEPAGADPLVEAAQIVKENMAQPCAAERAKQSALMLTEPGMSCQ